MRKCFSNAHYLLLALLLFALTACGTTASQTAATGGDRTAGKITAKLVYPKTTGKSVASAGANVTKIRLMVTGTQIPTAKHDFNAGESLTLECYPGDKLTVTAYAYEGTTGTTFAYEGFTANVTITESVKIDDPNSVTVPPAQIDSSTPVSIQLNAPVVKEANLPCLSCHEGTRDTDGQNLVVNYKQSGHYLNDSATFTPPAGSGYDSQAGCAGCHGTSHQTLNPATAGRCAQCHFINTPKTAAGINGNHMAYTGGADNTCGGCHVTHNYKGKSGCIGCHAVGQNSNTDYLVNDNNGVRAITSEFAKRSHHVTGREVKNSDCAVCHLEGKTGNLKRSR